MSKAAADISTALRLRNKFIGLTASFSKIDPRTFADNRQLAKLDTDDWQIVFGRRGAGKTTLLATYAQYITQADRIKSASIEVNVPDFVSVVESNGTRKIKDSELAKIYGDYSLDASSGWPSLPVSFLITNSRYNRLNWGGIWLEASTATRR